MGVGAMTRGGDGKKDHALLLPPGPLLERLTVQRPVILELVPDLVQLLVDALLLLLLVRARANVLDEVLREEGRLSKQFPLSCLLALFTCNPRIKTVFDILPSPSL